ncbi:CinA family protein [Prevotella sp. TCVGH]|uniref:CinA family protein n=1 Tax=Prevotella sp. TCVGH TaxID=2182433 RepID=UPI00201D5784|nr:CinA family protein [Prevotella sp. TCVGH]MCL6747698.1 CinA family protein [Prevotella sp. TCVGH]
MNFENKVISREIQQFLYDSNKTLGTAESCTGGRIAEVIAAVPGASNYFKGGIIAYSNELKIHLLGVNAQVIEEQTAVCEEVAMQMAVGLCQTINCDYAIAITGIAGPGGGTPTIPVGTIWIAYGSKDDMRTFKLTEDNGRDVNLANATNQALSLFLDFLKETLSHQELDSKE